MTLLDRFKKIRHGIVRTSLSSFLIIIGGTAVNFALAILLARVMGAEGMGIYVICMSIVNTIVCIGLLGTLPLVIRDIASHLVMNRYGEIRALLIRTLQFTLLSSTVLIIVSAVVGLALYDSALSGNPLPLLIGLFMVPFIIVEKIQGAAIRGLGHVTIGYLSEFLRPFLFLVYLMIMHFQTRFGMTPSNVIGARFVIAIVLTLLYGCVLVFLLPPLVFTQKSDSPEKFHWAKRILPFTIEGYMQIFMAEGGVLLLGIFGSTTAVACFRLAQRLGSIVMYGFRALNLTIEPVVVGLFAKGNQRQLQMITNRFWLSSVAFSCIASLLLIIFGITIIQVTVGAEFLEAYPVLVVLCIGYSIWVGMGPVGLFVNMSGNEKFYLYCVPVTLAAGCVAGIMLISVFGIVGAGISTSITMILWNALLLFPLYKSTRLATVWRPISPG